MASNVTGYRRLAGIALMAVTLLACFAPAARAADQVKSYVVDATVNADGLLAVKATMTFDGAAPSTIEQRLTTATRTADDHEYRYQVTDIVATAGTTALDAKVTTGPDTTTINIPTGGSTGPVTLAYVVHGAAIATDRNSTTVRWPLLQGLNIGVASFEGSVAVPGMFTELD